MEDEKNFMYLASVERALLEGMKKCRTVEECMECMDFALFVVQGAIEEHSKKWVA